MTTEPTNPTLVQPCDVVSSSAGTVHGIELETELERRIASDPRWQLGLDWGRPRPGHPEGSIRAHLQTVLANVDRLFGDSPLRRKLRLIALIHDTFKHEVDPDRPRSGANHHGMIARRFAEPLIDDQDVLDVIELHDEAYNAWQKGSRDGRWDRAIERVDALLDRLGPTRTLFVGFYRCDNSVEGKASDSYDWLQLQITRRYAAR
ncbi:MAG: hypothetical protein IT428_32900 [Planctomycetaceae bacterium]|nr:hypothetical protein [Planctomycetaceae bacterium]